MAISFPSTFIFGSGVELPLLPEGWTCVENAEDWLTAIDPSGERFVIERDNGQVFVTPIKQSEREGARAGEWELRGGQRKPLCYWVNADGLSIKEHWERFRNAALRGANPIDEHNRKVAFDAGIFIAFQMQSKLLELPLEKAAPILERIMKESDSNCVANLKTAFSFQN